MRRAAVTLVATVIGLVLLLSYKTHNGPSLPRPATLAPAPAPSSSASPSTGARPAPSSSAATRTRTEYGQPVNTRYGPVQVRVTESSGRIVRVEPVQLPDSRGRDIEIDNFAVPQLIQETLSAQSARIDMVSGATFTSEGYIQSLQSALDRF
jgi:uncharacterized protein with FMN-binding domain